eukprot:Partr_v1_DN26573_c0_g1_i2_m3545 putative DNA-dependent RNA polymerase catalyzes the transcription of DNA into RNA using the four ribonucleoside triphosphates as substrates. Specific core component of RNA polymerase III which synthesizes small RNAs, such as 5S rRNA and tRNAs
MIILLSQNVGAQILQEGRTSIFNISRNLAYPAARVKKALLILMAHHLVTFSDSTSLDAPLLVANGRVLINYCLEFDAVTMILRYPSFVQVARKLFGREGAAVIDILLKYGSLSPEDIVRESMGSLDLDTVMGVAARMFGYRYVVEAHSTDYRTVLDQILTREDEDQDKLDNVTRLSTKRKKIVDYTESVQTGQKRKASLMMQSRQLKLQRTEKGKTTSKGEEEEVQVDTVLRVNVSRFNLQLRTDAIVNYAYEFVNKPASEIMKFILGTVTDNDSDCLIQRDSQKVSIANIMHGLPSTLKMSVDGAGGLVSAQAARNSALNQYLEALASCQVKFLRKDDNVSMGGIYRVDFQSIVTHMRDDAMETYILDKFGDKSMRLYRTLQRFKILDEKGLSKYSLLPPKEARERLFKLCLEGLIEVQEVPRSHDRAPARTLFCWRRTDNAFENLLHRLYKSLYNLRLRRVTEEEMLGGLIEKAERADIAGNEGKLTALEKNSLQEFREKCERMVAYELRLDSILQILRDF